MTSERDDDDNCVRAPCRPECPMLREVSAICRVHLWACFTQLGEPVILGLIGSLKNIWHTSGVPCHLYVFHVLTT